MEFPENEGCPSVFAKGKYFCDRMYVTAGRVLTTIVLVSV